MKLAKVSTIIIFVVLANTLFALDDPDLVLYFPFEKLDGDTAFDQSGKGHNGKINGKIALVDNGKRDKAAQFEMNSFIDVNGPDMPPEDIPTDGITLSAWVKCEKTGQDHGIFNARASDSTWLIHPDIRSGGEYRFCLRGDGGVDICDIITGAAVWDEWIHYAGTYSKKSGEATLYINGEVIREIDALANVSIASDWELGARIGYNIDNERPFTGLMDDFCIWKRALTEEEINVLMEKGPEVLIEGESVSPIRSLIETWGEIKIKL